MPSWLASILHIGLVVGQLAPAFVQMTPDQHLALSTGLASLNGVLGMYQNKINPDGTPASVPYEKK